MKNKFIFIVALFTSFMFMPGVASAQITSSGALTVQAEIASSISMSFVSDGSGVSLTGTGTAATLDFGNVSQFSTPASTITQVNGSTSFTLSTPFDVSVLKSNVTSTNYTLSAQLATIDAVNVWAIDTVTVPTAPSTPSTVTATGAYTTNAVHTLTVTIPYSEAAGTITNTINFVATAN
jgi:hypothetical protein